MIRLIADEWEGMFSRELDRKLGILVKTTNNQSVISRGYQLTEVDGGGGGGDLVGL